MNAKWKLTWDYQAYKTHHSNLYTQADWDTTLLTKINQTSAQIFKASMYGGANELKMHPIVFSIIKNFEYYDDEKKILSGRFKVTVDSTLPEDKLYIFRNDYPMEPMHHVGGTDNYVIIHSDSPKFEGYKNNKEIELIIITPEMLTGEITIINYGQ